MFVLERVNLELLTLTLHLIEDEARIVPSNLKCYQGVPEGLWAGAPEGTILELFWATSWSV